MNYSQPQQYPPYQQNSYENQPQPCWNDVDASVPPAPFQGPHQFHRYPGEYHDRTSVLLSNEHNAPSPNYSQYLNFESMDTGPVDGPGDTIPPQAPFTTSPTLTTHPQQYAGFPIKIEPESETVELPFSRGPGADPTVYNSFPRTCSAAPSCLQILENPDMEMEDFKNMGDWFPPSAAPALDEQPPRRRPSHIVSGRSSESSGRKPSASAASTSPSTTSKKPRKRGRKPSTIDPDDEEAQARAKQAHSIVERRYRDNLNAKIMQLHHTLCTISSNSKTNALHTSPTPAEDTQEQAAPTSARVRKSDVMTDAVNYVHQSEVSMRHMTDEINRLTDRVRTLEKLVRCEDCVLLKEMVRRSIQGQERPRSQGQLQ